MSRLPPHGGYRLSALPHVVPRSDAPAVFAVTDASGHAHAVVLCASDAAPDMVERAMTRARHAKELLGKQDGQHVLDPIDEGRIHGLSYAVLPYCNALSGRRPVWWMQRALLRPVLFDWLWRATAATALPARPEEIESRFGEPLRYVASMAMLSEPVREAAARAAARLNGRAWHPRTTLMHGDLWKGNILVRRASKTPPYGWRERFVVIDWPGSEPHGHAFFDLVRLAQSFALDKRHLCSEVQRHCAALQCTDEDATGHLLAALGHIGAHLGHFPMEKYTRMVEACHACLASALKSMK